MNSLKVIAIIPARGGSKGVPGKNIKVLAGYPVIAFSIVAARMTLNICRTIVSTDSQEIADISKHFGAEVPFLRPAIFSGGLSPDRDFVMHALDWFIENEGSVPDFLVHLRPTTPLRTPALIDEAITNIISNPEATSLRSAHEAPESPFKWFMRDDIGYFYGFNPKDPRPGYSNLPRQSFPSVYVPDGYVDVLRTEFVLKSDDIHGNRIMGYVSPMCREIDTMEDLEFLKYQLTQSSNPLLDYLKLHFQQEP